MAAFFRFSARSMLCAALVAGCLAASAARAAVVEGCDEDTMQTQQAVAQARVAEAKAIDDEIFVQDDSVLALTCFNQSAVIAAKSSGDVFSGDFRAELAPVINDALGSMYSNYTTYTTGGSTGTVNYGASARAIDTTASNPTYNCNEIRNLWDAVNNQGVSPTMPYTSQTEMLDDTPVAGSGPNYQSARNSPAAVAQRGNARTRVNARPPPNVSPPPAVDISMCDALKGYGVIPMAATCPPP